MRVARAVLDLGLTSAQFHKLRKDLWFAHRLCVKGASDDVSAYRARIAAIVDVAAAAGADVLLLPACSLVGPLAPWLRVLVPVPRVVSGTLAFDGRAALGYREAGVVVDDGRVVTDFTSSNVVRAPDVDGLRTFAALSSTIGKLEVQTNNGVTIALDAGHHAYRARYGRTLRRVARNAAGDAGQSVVVLAFWRPSCGQTAWPWVETMRAAYSWARVPVTRGELVDYVDVIDFDSGDVEAR